VVIVAESDDVGDAGGVFALTEASSGGTNTHPRVQSNTRVTEQKNSSGDPASENPMARRSSGAIETVKKTPKLAADLGGYTEVVPRSTRSEVDDVAGVDGKGQGEVDVVPNAGSPVPSSIPSPAAAGGGPAAVAALRPKVRPRVLLGGRVAAAARSSGQRTRLRPRLGRRGQSTRTGFPRLLGRNERSASK
jgi:hypothetical protein